jgi:hypothetical protein
VSRTARDVTLTDGPAAGQTIHVHPKSGGVRGRSGGGSVLPPELWVCRPVDVDADPVPGPFHRYERGGDSYRYAPHQDQRETG